MRRLGKEKLADYVRRAMKQKQLKLREVEKRSGGDITNGYISGIITGRISNVSVSKLQALAKGVHEVDDLRRRLVDRRHHLVAGNLGVDDLAQLFLVVVLVLREIAFRLEVTDDLLRQLDLFRLHRLRQLYPSGPVHGAQSSSPANGQSLQPGVA